MLENFKTEGQLIKIALGDQWINLSPKTQARFEDEPNELKAKEYVGEMTEVKCSKLGKLMALATQCIRAPLIPYSDTKVPIDVRVYKEKNRTEIHKNRVYYFKGRTPFRVHSYMNLSAKGEFQEFVNSWLGMKMQVSAKNGNLYFIGTGYFIKLGGLEMPIPLFLSPGRAYIEHADHGEDSFKVKIEMIHPWFGLMFFQEGIFWEKHA